MLKSRFSVRLKQLFPQDVWSWIYLGLKQDSLVWENLENSGLGDQALQVLPADPEAWNPGNLAVLAVLGSLPVEPLNAQPLQPLDAATYDRVIQAGREWEHGDLAPIDLKKVGLVALYCREFSRRQLGWDELIARLPQQNRHLDSILATVYSLVPEPLGLLQRMLSNPQAQAPIHDVLHAVISNPSPGEKQLEALRALLEPSNLPQGLQIIRYLSLYRPWLSRSLAQDYLKQVNREIPQILTDEVPETQCDKIRDILYLAELHTLSGHSDQAIRDLNGTISAARTLQGKLAARYARVVSAMLEGDDKPPVTPQLQSVIVNAWKHAARLAPDVAEHNTGLVKALVSAGQPEQAQEIVQQLPEGLETTAMPGLLIASASLEDHFGDTSQAFQLAQLALSSMQAGGEVELDDVLVLARLFTRLGMPELVIQVARQALQRYPTNEELLGLAAQSYLLKEKPEQAVINIYSILAARDSSPQANKEIGRADVLQRMVIDSLERMGDWEAALSERTHLIERFAEPVAQDWHGIANCALRAGHPEQASEACSKALDINQNDAVAYQLLGETALAQGNLQQAIDRFQAAVHLAPTLPTGWLSLSKTYRLAGEHGQMLLTLRSASLALPESPEIHLALGEVYLEQDELTQALPSLRRAASLRPTPQIALQLGQTLLKLGHLEEARKVLERTLNQEASAERKILIQLPEQALSAQQAELHLAYARTLRAQNEPARAIPVYEKVLQSFPDLLDARFNLAKTLVEYSDDQENVERAILLLSEILDTKDTALEGPVENQSLLEEARLLLAENLARKGSYAESLLHYRQLLDVSNSYRPNELTRIATGFSRVALAMNEPERALALLKEASNNDPRNPGILKLQSEAYRANGLVEEAFEAARQLLELTPSDLENLIWFIEQAGSMQTMPGAGKLPLGTEVARALDYATQLAPTRADLLLRLGKALQESGDRFAAAEVYRRLASLDRQEYHINLKDLLVAAEALRAIGDAQMSVTLLQRIIAQVQSGVDASLIEELGHKHGLLRQLADSHFQAGDLQAALEALDAAIEAQPDETGLYIQRANLLEKTGNTQAALQNLETALQLDSTSCELQLRLAELLKKSGKLQEAFSQAERAVQQAIQLQDSAAVHSARLLAAELAFILLRHQQAWEFIHADLAANKEACDHLKHACLRAEMALEAREASLAREELDRLNEGISGENRFLAAQVQANLSRLAFLNKEFDQANQQFASAVSLLDEEALKLDAASADNPGTYLAAALRAVSRAALDLGRWDTAMNVSRRLAHLTLQEPLSHLLLVQVIVKRAEAQLLYQDLDVKKNAIGPMALSDEASQAFKEAISSVVCCLKGHQNTADALEIPLNDKSLPNLIKVWYARGLAAFEPNTSSAFLLGSELREVFSRPDELAALLTVFRRLGENSSVIKAVENFEKKDPTGNQITSDPLVQVQIALALEGAEAEMALSLIHQALAAMPDDHPLDWPAAAMLNYLAARIAVRAGLYTVAQAAIQDALMTWSDEASWHTLAARIFLSEDHEGDLPDLPQAIQHLEAVLRYEPENLWAHHQLGEIYLEREEFSRSSQSLEKAVQLSPSDAQLWLTLARLQLKTGSLDQAAKSAESALRVDQSSIEAALLRAEIALQANNPRGAIRKLQEILKTNADNVHALHLMARSLEALDRNEEAMTAIEKAIQLEGDSSPEMLLEKIRLVRKLEGFEPGLHFLQEKIQEHPQNIQLVVMLSDWLFEAGNQQSAVQVAQAVLQSKHYKLTPKQISELHFRTGFHMRRSGQLDQALHHLSKAIELSPGYLDAYLELGRAYQDQRAFQPALKIYQKAISVAPNDYRPYYYAGHAMKESKDFSNAEAMLKKAAQLAPDEVGVHRLLGAVVVLNLVHSRRITSDEMNKT